MGHSNRLLNANCHMLIWQLECRGEEHSVWSGCQDLNPGVLISWKA